MGTDTLNLIPIFQGEDHRPVIIIVIISHSLSRSSLSLSLTSSILSCLVSVLGFVLSGLGLGVCVLFVGVFSILSLVGLCYLQSLGFGNWVPVTSSNLPHPFRDEGWVAPQWQNSEGVQPTKTLLKNPSFQVSSIKETCFVFKHLSVLQMKSVDMNPATSTFQAEDWTESY